MATFLNALSKSFGSSEAPTWCAISTKRLWRSTSVSLGLGLDVDLPVFCVMPHTIANSCRLPQCGLFPRRLLYPPIATVHDLFFQQTAKRNDLITRLAPLRLLRLHYNAHSSCVFSNSFDFPDYQNGEDHKDAKCFAHLLSPPSRQIASNSAGRPS